MTPYEHDASRERARDADNALRYPGPWAGQVESHFVKANSPDGQRAIWIKHTVLARTARAEPSVAEVWAVAFAEGGRRKLAAKSTYPVRDLQSAASPFSWKLPCAELQANAARGEVARGGDRLAWDITWLPVAAPFRPFGFECMYTGRFPRSKTLTPVPDARARGTFRVFGESWDLAHWRAAQGHNWGASHAHAYAWVHANHWTREGHDAPLEGTWFEALSGQVALGRFLHTPWLSVAGLSLHHELRRFDRMRALTARHVEVDARSYRFELAQGPVRVLGEFRAEAEQLAGLRYEDPDGRVLACLNSKLARGRLELRDGSRRVVLRTEQAALELGTRRPGHGIELWV